MDRYSVKGNKEKDRKANNDSQILHRKQKTEQYQSRPTTNRTPEGQAVPDPLVAPVYFSSKYGVLCSDSLCCQQKYQGAYVFTNYTGFYRILYKFKYKL